MRTREKHGTTVINSNQPQGARQHQNVPSCMAPKLVQAHSGAMREPRPEGGSREHVLKFEYLPRPLPLGCILGPNLDVVSFLSVGPNLGNHLVASHSSQARGVRYASSTWHGHCHLQLRVVDCSGRSQSVDLCGSVRRLLEWAVRHAERHGQIPCRLMS
jgi:hypothetical protein